MTREDRLRELITESQGILDAVIAEHVTGPGKTLRGIVGLYSGGDDSTVLVDLFRDRITHIGHANTTIGIEATRVFVRQMARWWGKPLLEKYPPASYRELVIERGFPGPASHWKMYTRLKERCLEQIRNELIQRPRHDRVIFLAGRRRSESERRKAVPVSERKGSMVWCSPLVNWTKLDLNTYRTLRPELPRNPVAANIHMSGECLCGSFAKKGELDEISYWYPEVRKEIEALQREVAAAGHPEQICQWGWGAYRTERRSKSGPLCSSCEVT